MFLQNWAYGQYKLSLTKHTVWCILHYCGLFPCTHDRDKNDRADLNFNSSFLTLRFLPFYCHFPGPEIYETESLLWLKQATRSDSGKEYNLISFFLASYKNDDSPTPLACLRHSVRVNQTGLKSTPTQPRLKLA